MRYSDTRHFLKTEEKKEAVIRSNKKEEFRSRGTNGMKRAKERKHVRFKPEPQVS